MASRLFKVWDSTRTKKKMVLAKSLEELLSKASLKLGPMAASVELRVVLEKDGTDVDDDDALTFLTKDDVLMVLAPSQEWTDSSPSIINVYTDTNNDSFVAKTDKPSSSVEERNPTTTGLSSSVEERNLTTTVPSSSVEERNLTTTVPSSSVEERNLTTTVPSSSVEERNLTTTVPSSSVEERNLTTTVQPPPASFPSTSNAAQPVGEAPKSKLMLLPHYSDYIKAKLQVGDSHLVWSKMVQEAAHFYMAHYPQMGIGNSSGDYRTVGQAMYKAFPSIARNGTQPWTLFSSDLSQKIRHLRWDNKRKSSNLISKTSQPTVSPKRFRLQPSSDSEPEDAQDYDHHVQELSVEASKKEPNHSHIQTLLKATMRQRRVWIGSLPAGNVRMILERFPCFKHPAFFMLEMKLILKEGSLKPMFKRFELVFEAASSLMKKKKEGDDLDTLHYIEGETSFRHGKGQKTKSVVRVVVLEQTNKVEKLLTPAVDSPPSLVAVKNEGQIVNFSIVADGVSILLNSQCVEEALAHLMGFYYCTDLAYPRCFSQLLGFLQHVAVQQPFDGQKTTGFTHLLKQIKID